MADIDVVSELDVIDKLQVVLYRLGITIASIALLMPLLSRVGLLEDEVILILLGLGCTLIASSLHIYDKKIRWILTNATWTALVLFPVAELTMLGIMIDLVFGLLLVTLAGIAYKESFCFNVPGIKFVPYLLCGSAIARFFHFDGLYLGFASLAAILMLLLAIAKWRMPLHFDIGDKRKYQI